jgi:3-phenylpropionate/trans-cinnamate dioxygenase ferredoxin reductase component
MSRPRYVLVGGGVATAATATGLREAGFAGDIVLVAGEPHLPYERPPLSKEYLAGEFAREDFRVTGVPDDVELVLGTRAQALDPAVRRLSLSDGSTLTYDALVLGTGVRARTLPGFEGERVHVIRTIADSERLAPRLVPGRHLAILGAGFIGCEVAAVAAAKGVRVTVFEPEALPLARVVGPEIGRAMLGIHSEQGVVIRTGELVTGMTHNPSSVELTLRSGEVVECDDVLVGVGSVPNTELAVEAGLDVDGGILTDEHGRTSAPDVYAVGDVAARLHHGRHVRVEHHDTAVRHGAALARTLLGATEPWTGEHYFWSHQYEHNVQSIGRLGPLGGETVVRGSDRELTVFSLADGRITGMVALNRPRDLLAVRKLLAVPHQVTAAQLADEDFALKSLLPQRPRRSEVRA